MAKFRRLRPVAAMAVLDPAVAVRGTDGETPLLRIPDVPISPVELNSGADATGKPVAAPSETMGITYGVMLGTRIWCWIGGGSHSLELRVRVLVEDRPCQSYWAAAQRKAAKPFCGCFAACRPFDAVNTVRVHSLNWLIEAQASLRSRRAIVPVSAKPVISIAQAAGSGTSLMKLNEKAPKVCGGNGPGGP